MDIRPINKSKIGYAYQHKYSLLEILQFMNQGIIKEARIDFPFSSNLSLDLKIDLIAPNEIRIYEIKSGDYFKDDKSEEMGRILKHFLLFENEIGRQCRKSIVVAPEAKSRVVDKWGDFLFIKERKQKRQNGETRKDVLSRMYNDYGFRSLELPEKSFLSFINSVDLILGPSYKSVYSFHELTDLEDRIKTQIDIFCRELGTKSSDIEIPSWSIAAELLHTLHKCSERNIELVCEIWRNLFSCLMRRRLIKEAKFSKKEDKILDKIKGEVENFLVKKTNLDYRYKDLDGR